MTQPTRRDALKALAAASGAVTLASLPGSWSKPILRVGAVPAHAQVSCFDLMIEFSSGYSEHSFEYSTEPPGHDAGTQTNPSVGSGSWIWTCGLFTEYVCFTLTNNDGDDGIDVTVTSRDGTVLDIFLSALESLDICFDPTDGSFVAFD